MEEIEKKVRITKAKQTILNVLGVVGVISVGLIAPKALEALKAFGIDKKFGAKEKYSFFRSLKRLEKDGLVIHETIKGKQVYSLTEKGRNSLFMKPIKKEKRRWDKKWRVLIFDVPEDKKRIREKIRNTLHDWEFKRVQDSVWVYPYDSEDLVTLLKADLRIGKELLYLVVEEMEGDKDACIHFGLYR